MKHSLLRINLGLFISREPLELLASQTETLALAMCPHIGYARIDTEILLESSSPL